MTDNQDNEAADRHIVNPGSGEGGDASNNSPISSIPKSATDTPNPPVNQKSFSAARTETLSSCSDEKSLIQGSAQTEKERHDALWAPTPGYGEAPPDRRPPISRRHMKLIEMACHHNYEIPVQELTGTPAILVTMLADDKLKTRDRLQAMKTLIAIRRFSLDQLTTLHDLGILNPMEDDVRVVQMPLPGPPSTEIQQGRVDGDDESDDGEGDQCPT